MTTRPTTCAICSATFESKTSYGLCPTCFTKDTAREFDRLEAATRQARRDGVRATLTLVEWLSILSDFNAKCAYCMESFAYHIERADENKGLMKNNVVPCCPSCQVHKKNGWQASVRRVQEYLAGNVTFRTELLEGVGHV